MNRMAWMAAGLAAAAAWAHATETHWLVKGTNDWFEPVNWSAGVPGEGDHAVITGKSVFVLLTNGTPRLGGVTVSNGATLVFSNWNTTLSADAVVFGPQGTGTCIGPFTGPFTNAVMSNNLVIACGSFDLMAGGCIQLDGRGFRGAVTNVDGVEKKGHGPGGGISAANGHNGGGGGHGGRGGEGGLQVVAPATPGGDPYDEEFAPEQPGSGGGASITYSHFGGSGGGALKLFANGHVRIDGLVTAGGTRISSRGGGGSGGSVWLRCGTLSGSGAVFADGPGSVAAGVQSGGGAGGRIFVEVTNTAAQALLPRPDIVFSAQRGRSPYYADAELGTIAFPDTNLLDSARYVHTGRPVIPGFFAWEPDSLHVVNATVQFPSNAFRLSVAGDFSISGTNGVLYFPSNGVFEVGSNAVVSQGASLYLYGQTAGVSVVSVEGDLIVTPGAGATSGASLWITCPVSNQAPDTCAVRIDVGGALVVGSNSWVHLYSHPTNGGSVLFRVRDLLVTATNAGFNARGRGYTGARNGYGPGGGWRIGPFDSSPWGGGGYGGLGGCGATNGSGTPYGFAEGPLFPGSGGALRFPSAGPRDAMTDINGYGGGLIRIEAANRIQVDGTLTADGGNASRGGAGSGGGIDLRCRYFTGAAAGLLTAKGGRYTNVGAQDWAGGGGGGRIAIWRIREDFAGACSVSGGTSTSTNGGMVYGLEGTVFRGQLRGGSLVLIR